MQVKSVPETTPMPLKIAASTGGRYPPFGTAKANTPGAPRAQVLEDGALDRGLGAAAVMAHSALQSASFARVKFTMSLNEPSGCLTRYIPGHF
jgi:hypothetical protein